MRYFKVFVFIVLALFINLSYAQDTLSGTVTNHRNKPVANALIYLDSINSGVKTDKKGFYKVRLHDSVSTINVYSYKYGLLSSELSIQNVINFVFIDKKKNKSQKAGKDDKIEMNYSESEGKYIARSVSMVDPQKVVDVTSYNSIYDLIRGRVPGVEVTQNNRIRIRGVNSPNNTSEPLFVVDGTPVYSIDFILPINVKDITILKGSETSIYGSRGANGVVVIRTKN